MKSVGKFLKSQAILCLLALFIVFLAISRPSFVSPTNIKNVLMRSEEHTSELQSR